MKQFNRKTKTSHTTTSQAAIISVAFFSSCTILSGMILSSSTTKADTTVTSNASVNVNASCTITTGGDNITDTIDPGTYEEYTGTGINVSCNDPGGYALYAIGFSGDSYDAPNNNRMLGLNSTYIPTGNSGDGSYWAMKVAGSSTTSTVPTIDNSYSTYQIIPATYTMVSHYGSSTTGTTTNSVTTPTYKVQIASDQSVGTYAGKVKYTMVHPSTAPAPTPEPPINPYCTDEATCMQTSTACDTTLTDGRDGATYTTATIAGTCWMTQNLRFQGTDLKVGESDVTSPITMTYGQLTDGNSYTEPRIATGSTTDYGTYYNYCAVSAGEVCNDTTQQDATRSVCPAGWKLPTQAQLNAVPEKDSHFTASSGLAGGYGGGSLGSAGSGGGWWASTANSATSQYYLYYGSVYGGFWLVNGLYKYYGYSVRCVRAS